MENLTAFFQKKGVKRFFIFALLVLILYSVRSLMNILLLTFIISYLMNGFVNWVTSRIRINRTFFILLLYSGIVTILVFGIVRYLPIITYEISQLIKQITHFTRQSHDNTVITFLQSIISTE